MLDKFNCLNTQPKNIPQATAEDSAFDMGRAAARSYQKINRQLPQTSASACYTSTQNADTLNINLQNSLVNLVVDIFDD